MIPKDALAFLKQKQWSRLKDVLASLSPQAKYEIINYCGEKTDLGVSLEGLIDGPQDVLGLTIFGAIQREIGHRHRGKNAADKTSEAQFEQYFEHLAGAKTALEQALSTEPHNGLACAVYMKISADPIEEGQKDAAEAKLLAAQDVPLSGYVNLLRARLEKWGGSHEEMFRIARSRMQPNTPMQNMLIAYAHFERQLFYSAFDDSPSAQKMAENYYSNRNVIEEILEASRIILSTKDADPAGQRLADSWMAFTLGLGEQPKAAVRHLKRLKGYTEPSVWGLSYSPPWLLKGLFRYQALLS